MAAGARHGLAPTSYGRAWLYGHRAGDIMNADGTMNIPIVGGKHLKEDVVGSHFANYDFVVNLAHFKGHAMGGFGGVIKICPLHRVSARKCLIHTAGASSTSLGVATRIIS